MSVSLQRRFDDYLDRREHWPTVRVDEFVRAPWGLGFTPFPTQTFMLKLIFGEELDNKTRKITTRDIYGERVLGKFTEAEYLQYLYNEGRSSIKYQEGEIRDLVWNGGRKSTKSTVVSLALIYRLYQILAYYDPFEFFGLPEDTSIGMTNLASSEDQASVVFANVQASVLKSPFFRQLLARDPTTSKIELFTRKQRDKFHGLNGFKRDKLVRASFIVSITVATEASARGPNNCMLVFDEFAFFDLGAKDSRRIYKAVRPSIAAFGKFAKTLMISSPATKNGMFYEMYQKATELQRPDFVYIETPTAEFNPTIDKDFLAEEFQRDPQMALVEYGAKWEGATHRFFERGELGELVTHEPHVICVAKDEPHYVGVDLGVETDGTVFCIAHAERDVVVIDDVIWFYAGYGKYEDFDELPLMEEGDDGGRFGLVVDLMKFVRPFPIQGGLTDQWNGKGLVSLAKVLGMSWMQAEHMSEKLNWEISRVFQQLVREKKIRFPKKPEVLENLYELERIMLKRSVDGRRMFAVRTPEKPRATPPEGHDDIYSALSRAVWLVYTKEIETGAAIARHERKTKQRQSPNRIGKLQRITDRSVRMGRLRQKRQTHGGVGTFVRGRR